MKSNEIREKTIEELVVEEKELKEELFKLRFQLATNQLENAMKIKEVRKDIARVKTIAREKEMAASKE